MFDTGKKRTIAAAVTAMAIVAVAVGIAAATGVADGDDMPLTGATLERATTAALAHTGGGTVIETEVGDDGAAYSVEVRLRDGTEVEVNMDDNFNVIGEEAEDEEEEDDDDD